MKALVLDHPVEQMQFAKKDTVSDLVHACLITMVIHMLNVDQNAFSIPIARKIEPA